MYIPLLSALHALHRLILLQTSGLGTAVIILTVHGRSEGRGIYPGLPTKQAGISVNIPIRNQETTQQFEQRKLKELLTVTGISHKKV